MILVDSHCHVNFKAYHADADEVIRRSFDSGVGIINVGTFYATSKSGVELARKYDHIWAAVGLHPSHACPELAEGRYIDPDEGAVNEQFDPEKYRELAQSSDKVVALGECGLDYYRLDTENTKTQKTQKHKINVAQIKSMQKDLLLKQIKLAHELHLPISFHVRGSKDKPEDAYRDLIQILSAVSSYQLDVPRGVIHCFSGTKEIAQQFLDLGLYISFTGIITFKNAGDLANVVKQVPLNRILVETDAPYLAPEPYRGQRNEPSYVKHIAEKIAAIKNTSFEEVAQMTTKNAVELFKL